MIERYRIVRYPDHAEVHLVSFDGKMNPINSRKATDKETSDPKTWKRVSHDIGSSEYMARRNWERK